MGIQSSLHMPDKVLNFVKDHFLMDSVIRSAPLLLKRSVRYTQIAVHKIQGMERAYDVLFIGTGELRNNSRGTLRGKSVKYTFVCFYLLLLSCHKLPPAFSLSRFHSLDVSSR